MVDLCDDPGGSGMEDKLNARDVDDILGKLVDHDVDQDRDYEDSW